SWTSNSPFVPAVGRRRKGTCNADSTPNPSRPAQEVEKRDEQGAADNRPHDRKRISTHTQDERFTETELPSDPRSKQRTDEPDGGGNDEPAAHAAAQRSAHSPTDRRNNNQHDKPGQCQRHTTSLSTDKRCKDETGRRRQDWRRER